MLGTRTELCPLCEEHPRAGRFFVVQIAEVGAGGRAWVDVAGEACAACGADLDRMKHLQGVGIAGVLGTCLFGCLAFTGNLILVALALISLVATVVAIVKIQDLKRRLIERVVDSPALEPLIERVGAMANVLTWQSFQIHPRAELDASATAFDDLVAALPRKRRLGKRGRGF